MKAFIKSVVLFYLRFLARLRLKRTNATIIGITGSVGKTSAKEMISAVLSAEFKVKKSSKNHNTDIGLALSLLDQDSAYSSAWGWLKVMVQSGLTVFQKTPHYDFLVLEMGVDQPGDMDRILKLVTPDVMVFLNVRDVHLGEGQFKDRQEILKEKGKACLAVPSEGFVLLNGDDPLLADFKGEPKAETICYGEKSHNRAQVASIRMKGLNLHFDVLDEEGHHQLYLPKTLGFYHANLALAAVAVARQFGQSYESIQKGLKRFKMPAGRLNVLEGVHDSTLIDGSYNASPSSMKAALDVLSGFAGRRIAALGTMNELGELTRESHLKLGAYAKSRCEVLICVGPEAETIAEGAREAGFSEDRLFSFEESAKAGIKLRALLKKGDIALVKGSQNNVRMERVVEACLAHPDRDRDQLVRQSSYWKKK